MLTGRKVPGDLARQVELAALGRARQHDEQSLARVGVLNKDDLVDELTLALTALAPEPRDRRTAGALGPARRRAALARGTVPTRAASGHCACVLIGNGSEPVL